MFFSKASFLLYYLALYDARVEALPQLLVFHLDSPRSTSSASSTITSSPLGPAPTRLKPSLEADRFKEEPPSPSSPPTSTITDSAALSSIWVNMPPVSGFTYPGVILSVKFSSETIDLPPVSGFSYPGVAFETSLLAATQTATVSAPLAESAAPSSTKLGSSETSHAYPSRTTQRETQTSSPTSPPPSTTEKATIFTTITVKPQPHSVMSEVHSAGVLTISVETLVTETLPAPTVDGMTSRLPNQGVTQVSTYTAGAAYSQTATPTPTPQPSITTGSEIALGVTIPIGVFLLLAVIFFVFRRPTRPNANPFSDQMAYKAANPHDNGSPPIRPLWYRNPVAPPPSINRSTPSISPPNLDELNNLVDPTDPFVDTPETYNNRWTRFSSLKKLPWTFGVAKKQPVFPEVAYLYDTPSVNSRDVETAYASSNRASYKSLSTAPEGRMSYESVSGISAPSANPNLLSFDANPNTNRSTWDTLFTREMTSTGRDSAFVSPVISRVQSGRPRANSVEMSPRVRYLHEGSDEAVLELLPEGIEDAWTPAEDVLAARGPILERAIPEVPEIPEEPEPTDAIPELAVTEGTELTRNGSVSIDFAGTAAAAAAGSATAGARSAPAWQRGRGVEGLGIDTSLHTVRKEEEEARGWSEGRWRGPPRKEETS